MRPSLLPSVLLLLAASPIINAASYSPSIDLSNGTQLQQATKAALTNLLKFYVPNSVRLFFLLAFCLPSFLLRTEVLSEVHLMDEYSLRARWMEE